MFSPRGADDRRGGGHGGRCGWCGTDPLYVAYHDEEWGVPEHDPRALWEKLVLDGFQAGLAWITILRKREGFRAAFAGFDPEVIAGWGEAEVAGSWPTRASSGTGARSRRPSATPAPSSRSRRAKASRRSCGSTSTDRPVQNRFATLAEVPCRDARLPRDVEGPARAGFRFCGPTIVYAFMQATGW
jgi:DNA-3-methyladenine glycosylase I